MYSVRIWDAALHDLTRIDRSVGRRIVERITWLCENFENIHPERLTGELAGLYKFRVGDYRIVYEVLDQERLIVIHAIGHRRDIYRKR